MDGIKIACDAGTIVGSRYCCCSPTNANPNAVWKQIFPENDNISMVGRSCLTACIKSSFVELPDLYLDCFQIHPPELVARIIKEFNLSSAKKEVEILKKLDRFVLSQMPLALLTSEIFRSWLIPCLCASEQEICGISVRDFSNLNWRQRRVILKRLECIEKKGVPKGNLKENSVGLIRQMKPEEFFVRFPHVPNYALELLTKTQRDLCDFSKVSADTLRRLSERGNLLFSQGQKERIDQLLALDEMASEARITETLIRLEQEALEEQLSIAKKKLRPMIKSSACLNSNPLPDNTPFPDFDKL